MNQPIAKNQTDFTDSNNGWDNKGLDVSRTGAALRDISHYTSILFSGKQHLEFLHRMTTSHFLNLQVGEGFETVFPDNRGRIFSFGTFTRIDQNVTLGVIPSTKGHSLIDWLDGYLFNEDVLFKDITENTSGIEIIGPCFIDIIKSNWPHLFSSDITIPYHLSSKTVEQPFVLGQKYGRVPGARLIGPPSAIEEMALRVLKTGCGRMSDIDFDTMRIEEGYPTLENELTDAHNPWEADLKRTIDLNKGCYIGQEIIARLNTYNKVKQHLVGLHLSDDQPEAGDKLMAIGGLHAGKITSAAFSPLLGNRIALAYLRKEFCSPGTNLTLCDTDRISGKITVCDLPFAL